MTTHPDNHLWQAAIFLEDRWQRHGPTRQQRFTGKGQAQLWIMAQLERLRMVHGCGLGGDKQAFYVAELTGPPGAETVCNAYLFDTACPIEWDEGETPRNGALEICPACGFEMTTPRDITVWQPQADDDPGPAVSVLARLNESPVARRAVRLPRGLGWLLLGNQLDRHTTAHPIRTWPRVGECSAGQSHPVLAVHQDNDGIWVPGIIPGAVGAKSRELAAWLAAEPRHPRALPTPRTPT
jgi:hypothetical protein